MNPYRIVTEYNFANVLYQEKGLYRLGMFLTSVSTHPKLATKQTKNRWISTNKI